MYAAVLISQGKPWEIDTSRSLTNMNTGLINTFGVHLLKYLNNVSIWWHAVGTIAVIISVLASAPKLQSGSFVFTRFMDNTGDPGWSVRAGKGYVVMIGILMAQYTLTGFDASAHVREPCENYPIYLLIQSCIQMTEETHNAAMSGSIGIVMAIGVSTLLGWFLILGLLFSIQDLDATVRSTTGQPVTQIFLDTVGPKGAIALMVIVIGCMYFCGWATCPPRSPTTDYPPYPAFFPSHPTPG